MYSIHYFLREYRSDESDDTDSGSTVGVNNSVDRTSSQPKTPERMDFWKFLLDKLKQRSA